MVVLVSVLQVVCSLDFCRCSSSDLMMPPPPPLLCGLRLNREGPVEEELEVVSPAALTKTPLSVIKKLWF